MLGQGNGQGRTQGPWQKYEGGQGICPICHPEDENKDSDSDGLIELLDSM
jgi:hypothetical protein